MLSLLPRRISYFLPSSRMGIRFWFIPVTEYLAETRRTIIFSLLWTQLIRLFRTASRLCAKVELEAKAAEGFL